MKGDIKISQFAKKLVELSKEDEVVTEAKVTEVLGALKQVNHRHHLTILKAYLNYMRREIALQTAVVSAPIKLSEENLKAIEAHFTREYNRPIQAVLKQDESLIAGVKIRIGDDVYDASVARHLQRLAENIH
jgi:F-type H+-transporting ATPase subunit delta